MGNKITPDRKHRIFALVFIVNFAGGSVRSVRREHGLNEHVNFPHEHIGLVLHGVVDDGSPSSSLGLDDCAHFPIIPLDWSMVVANKCDYQCFLFLVMGSRVSGDGGMTIACIFG